MDATKRATRIATGAVWLAACAAFATWTMPTVDAQRRDRGVNQPGAAGNAGGVDPGVNQPGAAGNRGGVDPGINQPGAVGNRGVPAATPAGYGGSARQVRAVADPGVNQPGAVGNVGRDPGLNQPGAVGNRR